MTKNYAYGDRGASSDKVDVGDMGEPREAEIGDMEQTVLPPEN